MNKSQMFADAHKEARQMVTYGFKYKVAFALALRGCWNYSEKYTMSEESKVDSVSDFLVNYTGNAGKYSSYKQQADKAASLIHQATLCGGFAAQVAETVQNTRRCSPKQAIIIAKALVANNRVNNFTF